MDVSTEDAIAATNDEVGLGRSAAIRRLRRVDTVVFDCDSTLSALEGIDELAREAGADVTALTDAAMRGELRLEQVYGHRLALVRPNQARIDELGSQYIASVVPDAREVISSLQQEGIQVRIMSGGLRPAVEKLATELGVAGKNVAAVDVHFTKDGEYRGFDEASPLARAGGKRELLQAWRRGLSGPLMFVGDGATDLETSGIADVFVAYAGVVERANVVAGADVVVRSPSLAPVFALALGGHRPQRTASQGLYDKGLGLLEDVYRSYLGNGNAT